MDREQVKVRLMCCFPNSFFNTKEEFIAHKFSNTYFIFSNCETELDVKCKILEWFSRSAYKGMPYSSEWRNKKFREFMRNGINEFLRTDFSEEQLEEIYTKLGNAIRHNLTIKFVESGYDLSLLK